MSNMPKKYQTFYKDFIANLLIEHAKGKVWGIDELKKHDKILYSTFGFHDAEPPHSIVKRKLDEVENENNVAGLWGVSKKTDIDKVVKFCKEIKAEGKQPYLLLKFTPSMEQARKENAEWEKEYTAEILLKENCFKSCRTQDGKTHEINSEKTGIVVKGTGEQNRAFVVKDYVLVGEILANPQTLKNTFYSGFESFQNTSRLTLKEGVDLSSMVGTNWGIALKLKAPYIVDLF